MGTVLHPYAVSRSEDIAVNKSDMLPVYMELKFQWMTKETFTIKERRNI